ncbi:CBS domain-containing protein [Streptomyces sp. NPDC018693]|uniref:CBS domain-containing protein n=1 Tax=unclassified Streptomyces TaxID=2593676 RepID=UPI0037B3A452
MAHQHVQEVMTRDPVTVTERTPLTEVAQLMRERNIGDVIVAEADEVRGLVTDRDLVVRAIADQRDPASTTVGEVCSHDLVTCSSQDDIDVAVRLMREHALRRLPVIDDGRLVGALSLGDLAVERDPRSALADISTAEPNT